MKTMNAIHVPEEPKPVTPSPATVAEFRAKQKAALTSVATSVNRQLARKTALTNVASVITAATA